MTVLTGLVRHLLVSRVNVNVNVTADRRRHCLTGENPYLKRTEGRYETRPAPYRLRPQLEMCNVEKYLSLRRTCLMSKFVI